MSVPEVRWCENSGVVRRRCDDRTWAVLDVVPPGGLRQEAELIAGDIQLDWKWHRATRRRYRIRTVLAFAVGVALGAPLGRWFW